METNTRKLNYWKNIFGEPTCSGIKPYVLELVLVSEPNGRENMGKELDLSRHVNRAASAFVQRREICLLKNIYLMPRRAL